MTIPAYTTLGISHSALTESWSEPQPFIAPQSADMEGGNTRLRSLPGDEISQLQFDILFTNTEFATFKTYVKTPLGNGSARFVMPVWTGSAYETKTVQFVEPYADQAIPPKYIQVTFKLRIYP